MLKNIFYKNTSIHLLLFLASLVTS